MIGFIVAGVCDPVCTFLETQPRGRRPTKAGPARFVQVGFFGAQMWKGFFLGIILTVGVAALVIWIVGREGLVSAAALNARPVPLENWMARNSLRANLIRNAPQGRIPIPNNEDTLITGVRLYAVNCIVCHGTSTGNAGATPIAKGMYPAPPQLASEGVEDDPLGWTFWKIKNGIRWTGMPAWQSKLNDQQIWALTLFLSQMNRLPPAVQQVWGEVRQYAFSNPVGSPPPASPRK